jgi:formaldehyde-activating enzyme involved in methanogenesis
MPSRTPNHRVQKNHPPEQIIGDKNAGIETRGSKRFHTPEQRHLALLSIIEPNNLRKPVMMNIGSRPWKKNYIK